jgi:hypothetical protein
LRIRTSGTSAIDAAFSRLDVGFEPVQPERLERVAHDGTQALAHQALPLEAGANA